MKMCKVIYVPPAWTASATMKKVEEKLLELTYEGWEIMTVSFTKNGWGSKIAMITVSTTDKEKIEQKTFKIVKLSASNLTALAKKVDDEMMKMMDSFWEVISVSFSINSWGKNEANITICRPYDENFV